MTKQNVFQHKSSSKTELIDILIVGAGPVGLMCAHLAKLCGLSVMIVDKSEGPLKLGRADALNARTLQLLELGKIFSDIYPLGKACNTSSVWKDGKFLSRQSSWWDSLEGCFHKHFLMIGQSYVEQLLDSRLKDSGNAVRRRTSIKGIQVDEMQCLTTLSNGEEIRSRFVIGADGSRSFVREQFSIPFEMVRPQIIWAVIDGVIETDFNKVPEIIVFQNETSDVAWIPREKNIDRFYVRMDREDFTIDDAIAKINRAMSPHQLKFKEIEWFSQFSVKESIAEKFSVQDRVFIAGDACHIHSVNGGQGLNTGLADAFNLIWKLNMVLKVGASANLLKTYESERKPVAQSVIESSGELVRSTKYSETGTHAQDYVKIVEKRSGNITGMGIRYGISGISGTRLHDLELRYRSKELGRRENLQFDNPQLEKRPTGQTLGKVRLYSLLDYSRFTLLVFSDHQQIDDLTENILAKLSSILSTDGQPITKSSALQKSALISTPIQNPVNPMTRLELLFPKLIKVVFIQSQSLDEGFWTEDSTYKNQIVLVRPDSYIAETYPIQAIESVASIDDRPTKHSFTEEVIS